MSFFARLSAAILTGSVTLSGCSSPAEQSSQDAAATTQPVRKTVEVVESRPFPANAFVQGLELIDGTDTLVVGTGWEGESEVFRTQLGSTSREGSVPLPLDQFGEGLTLAGDVLWQITWKDQVAYKRDASTFKELETVTYEGQGWGLCAFDDTLVMSDGSGELTFRDPSSFHETGSITVTNSGAATTSLNELECVTDADGSRSVYANVFQSTDIYRIDIATGHVTEIIDASPLENNAPADSNNVLNGIAYLPESDTFALTGKRWPDLYRVRFVEN